MHRITLLRLKSSELHKSLNDHYIVILQIIITIFFLYFTFAVVSVFFFSLGAFYVFAWRWLLDGWKCLRAITIHSHFQRSFDNFLWFCFYLLACYYFSLCFFLSCTICATSFAMPCDIWFVLIFITHSMSYDFYARTVARWCLVAIAQWWNRRNAKQREGKSDDRRVLTWIRCIPFTQSRRSPWERQWNAAQHLSPAEYLCWWWQTWNNLKISNEKKRRLEERKCCFYAAKGNVDLS